jgi:hypothetical protein
MLKPHSKLSIHVEEVMDHHCQKRKNILKSSTFAQKIGGGGDCLQKDYKLMSL